LEKTTGGGMPNILKILNEWTKASTKRKVGTDPEGDFKLVNQVTTFHTSDKVMHRLPDILGRAMARCWIDKAFQREFELDPKYFLSRYGVFLPENVSIEMETEGVTRPKIVVNEIGKLGGKKRLIYLQLVMMAGK
jgi:hypothetical protein